MTMFFTSDTHFNHKNIIEYCKRPWQTIEDMNNGMIDKWNSVVGVSDTVVHIGDFAMGPKAERYGFVKRLNGKIILVKGNHDDVKNNVLTAAGFSSVVDTYEFVDPKYGRVLCEHVPNRMNKHDYMLSGHVHDTWRHLGNIINVGVDVRDFTPKTLDQLVSDTIFQKAVDKLAGFEPKVFHIP